MGVLNHIVSEFVEDDNVVTVVYCIKTDSFLAHKPRHFVLTLHKHVVRRLLVNANTVFVVRLAFLTLLSRGYCCGSPVTGTRCRASLGEKSFPEREKSPSRTTFAVIAISMIPASVFITL